MRRTRAGSFPSRQIRSDIGRRQCGNKDGLHRTAKRGYDESTLNPIDPNCPPRKLENGYMFFVTSCSANIASWRFKCAHCASRRDWRFWFIKTNVVRKMNVHGYGSSDLRQGRAPLPGMGVVEYGSGWENNPAPRIGVSSWSNCGGTLGSDAASSAGGSRFRGRHKGDRLRFATLPKLTGQC